VARPVALTIAGSDPSGGAGVVADMRTFAAHGLWPCAAITAVTAQNATAVSAVHAVPVEVLRAQVEAVASSCVVRAVKTGMLVNAEVVRAVSAALRKLALPNLVVDPVMFASSGAELLDASGQKALATELLPLAAVVTPNLAEAEVLLAQPVVTREDMAAAAAALVARGAGAALVTGGHLNGERVVDCLVVAGGAAPVWLSAPRLHTAHLHGTGCVLSAAICAGLALGQPVEVAARAAKEFTTAAIAAGWGGSADPGSASAPAW